MTIYDVEKLATPGDLILKPGGTALLLPSGWVADRDAWFLGASETIHFASTDQNHRPGKEQRANAVLVQHRYNNFNKALETLKKWQAAHAAWMASDDPDWTEWPDSTELIRTLEEVRS